ncbi:D-beta-hydroxybutyrate dehydrogenase, mitochondrial-like [Daktulosphaira vitifoliae]|uniref:D-beta-hydroxybutyrate dehydrogenase, mitochondrial-like n=1 Tax=Daktulosphaira vitifoliae TaxID=58002 RepID=UPI0021AAB232|nr:D-beta-hydroxybutyrate dehydrogenase, mitochondrial-like [Daktulosphaira vitifoliae]
MDEETIVVLGVQLLALCCIICSIVIYLLRKMNRKTVYATPAHRSVLITSCETSVGLQLCDKLSSAGFRVFAGYKPMSETDDGTLSEACISLRIKIKQRESTDMERAQCGIVFMRLDVTREDSLHEAVDTIKRHLPAGEDGLWAVINTADVCLKGKIELQESVQWEMLFKTNVFGSFKVARTFYPLLISQRGRLINIGISESHTHRHGMTAFDAARYAVVGASKSLQQDLKELSVRIIIINTNHILPENLFEPVKSTRDANKTNFNDQQIKQILPDYAIHTIFDALLEPNPKTVYNLEKPSNFINNRFFKFKTLKSEKILNF